MTQNHDTSLNVDTLQIVTDLAKRRWYHQAVKGEPDYGASTPW